MRASALWRAATFAALVPAVSACDWFTTFRYQPKLDTWGNMTIAKDTALKYYWPEKSFLGPHWTEKDGELAFRGNPMYSVPITGTALPYFQISNASLPGVIDSIGAAVTNPVPVSDSSLALGRRYFQINCAVCHGDDGAGTKNLVIAKYGLGINIVGALTKARTDGYIFGMIRNGRGLMPNYNRIEEAERWHVVNYVRGLQGKLGREVAKGPVGFPGETGAALPGATETGPTRPVPFARPATPTAGVDVRGAATDAATTAKKGGTP